MAGLYDAFSRNEDLNQEILLSSLAETVPLSKTMSEDLSRLRNWANGRARPASGSAAVTTELRRKLEL